MTVLSFSLTPEATGRFHDALVCLAKFGEFVSLEARKDKAGPTVVIVQRPIANSTTAHYYCSEPIQDSVRGICA